MRIRNSAAVDLKKRKEKRRKEKKRCLVSSIENSIAATLYERDESGTEEFLSLK